MYRSKRVRIPQEYPQNEEITQIVDKYRDLGYYAYITSGYRELFATRKLEEKWGELNFKFVRKERLKNLDIDSQLEDIRFWNCL